ncbi:MAG: NGG1p interacting factor NIF3, partial [Firmicutes bacterium HGW-Firmicutes-12]
MQLAEIYNLFIQLGKENDPRPEIEIKRYFKSIKKQYEEMKEAERQYFDTERLTNPYFDTRILYGDPQIEVKRVMVGIDMETPEVLMADRLREKGERVDLVIAHHPEGRALVSLYRVMHMQEDMLADLGVPINVAEGILSSRINEVERALMPLNHNRTVDAARLLGLPFMCVHTPADNMVNTFLTNLFNEKQPETLGDIVKALKELPEYHEAARIGAGPKIVVGKDNNRIGKIFVDMTGGTGGSEDAYAKLAVAGVGTIIGMHIGEKHRKEAEKNHINVIIAGHMASDSLGINLL